MKIHLKKYTPIFVLMFFYVISCSDYLNIDQYFDDELNIDSVFTNKRYMEAYMWGASSLFP